MTTYFTETLVGFKESIQAQEKMTDSMTGRIFGYHVSDPRSYGVVEMDHKSGKVISLEEKPQKPKSKLAIPGLYIFDSSVADRADSLKASARGETEITDLMKSYHDEDLLAARRIGRGVAWLDTGTPKSLMEASAYICSIEERQSLKVACLEEIAYRMEFIDDNQFSKSIERLPNCSYRDYLSELTNSF